MQCQQQWSSKETDTMKAGGSRFTWSRFRLSSVAISRTKLVAPNEWMVLRWYTIEKINNKFWLLFISLQTYSLLDTNTTLFRFTSYRYTAMIYQARKTYIQQCVNNARVGHDDFTQPLHLTHPLKPLRKITKFALDVYTSNTGRWTLTDFSQKFRYYM